MYTTDYYNHRVVVMNQKGELATFLGAGHLKKPGSIAINYVLLVIVRGLSSSNTSSNVTQNYYCHDQIKTWGPPHHTPNAL